MSLDETIIENSDTPAAPIGALDAVEKPKRRPRAELLNEGKLVLTKKLDPTVIFSLGISIVMGRFKKIIHPNITEHLDPNEEKKFIDEIHIEKLPPGGIIEVWHQIPGSSDYQVVEYEKIK